MSECTHDCSSCSSDCSDRTSPQSFLAEPNKKSNVKKVIGIVSGKGGVGKSLVTELLAVATAKSGKKTAIMDADITGPSIPKAFGLTEKANGSEDGIYPVKTKLGIDVMSINLLLEDITDPVIWRGPVIGGTVKQFWSDVIWEDIDTMYVDMPPGTGDVPLTVFQSIPVDGVIIVTSPQDLVKMIVGKAVGMAHLMNIPILGIVENMSYVECGNCGNKIHIFGESHTQTISEKYDLPILAEIPLREGQAAAADSGNIETLDIPELENVVHTIESL